ncbi:MAG TPA: CocE/NonD family hydrolase [Ktedonobacteraceae bacterium]|nr:CocE/NonD family hydrolase [Ktedonobacteraceae bacterium]
MAMQLGQQIVVDYDVPATMRDGVVLRANIFRPAAEGRWPVLLTRLPYGKDLASGGAVLDPAQAARRGYVVIVQDTRGRFASEGEWTPMRNEALDGVDTIAWAASLPYSNGEIGMYGASYYGFTQWSAAIHQPEALKAMVPFITWNDPLNGNLFRGGAFELGISAGWSAMMGLNVVMRRHMGNPQALGGAIYSLVQALDTMGSRGYWSLPLRQFEPLKRNDVAPIFFEPLEKPMDREIVDEMMILGKHEQVTVPTFNIGGWYDIFLQDTISNFKIMREQGRTPEARQSKLLIGPWTHGDVGARVGEMNFGMASSGMLIDYRIDLMSLQLRWFDHWMRHIDTGMLNEAPIKIFVMGANIWRDEQEWPLARAVETRYYLHSNGEANLLGDTGRLDIQEPETEQPDNYSYDPANPVLTRGGALLMAIEYPGGAFDQRAIEERSDVLVYSTPVLEQPIEVTGPIKVHLWARSDALDTDFVARLVDVHPNGFSQNLTDGIIRARYRNFAKGEQPSLLTPGTAYEYEIDLWSTSNLFLPGHRIRLDVTSSNFPRWDRNPNTGAELGENAEIVVAHQEILHDREHPSYIVLPIVPIEMPAEGVSQ